MKLLNVDKTSKKSYDISKLNIQKSFKARTSVDCHSVDRDTYRICIYNCLKCKFAKKVLKMKAKLNENVKYR